MTPIRIREYAPRGPQKHPRVAGTVRPQELDKARAAGRQAVFERFGDLERGEWRHKHRLVYMRAYWALYSTFLGARVGAWRKSRW